MLRIEDFSVCHRISPLGLDEQPVFSWRLCSDQNNVFQTAYRITVSDETGALFDSGWRVEAQSLGIAWKNANLRPFTSYCATLIVRDNHEQEAEAETFFETGILDPALFTARFITAPESLSLNALPVFLRSFSLQKEIKKARLCLSACGLYHATVNRQNVADTLLAPGWTDYRQRIQYQVYDVTKLLKEENTLRVTVPPGWYAGDVNGHENTFGTRTAAFAQLHIWYADGEEKTIGTDESWQIATGPMISSSIYHGETTDYTQPESIQGYAEILSDVSSCRLIAQQCEPVRVLKRLPAQRILHTPQGDTVIDFGQNIAGFAEIKVCARENQRITVRHAEMLDRYGNFYTQNLRTAKAKDTYLCKAGEILLRPMFTYHGFRYIAVEGIEEPLDPSCFTACAIGSDLRNTADLSCDHPLVNRLWQNIWWTMTDNFMDVPTDCPQRDERLGWTGDAAVFSRSACQIKDTYLFFRKWLADLALDQTEDGAAPDMVPNIIAPHGGTAVWADAAVIIPWEVYKNSGDLDILRRQYASMKAWIGWQRAHETENHLRQGGFQRGDWLALDREEGKGNRGSTDRDLIATAFYAHGAWIASQAAKALGNQAEAEEYQRLFEDIRAGYQQEYITVTGRLVSETQTACVLTLAFDLAKPQDRPRIKRALVENINGHGGKLTTGFVGIAWLCHALTENGHHDLACKLLLNEDFPGWLREVKLGGTTLWERWDSLRDDGTMDESGMNSFNHYAFASIASWILEVMGGITPALPGYRRIRIRPKPVPGIREMQAKRITPYGVCSVSYRALNGTVHAECVIPCNSEAEVWMPGWEQEKTLGSGVWAFDYQSDAFRGKNRWTLDVTISELLQDQAALKTLKELLPGMAPALQMPALQDKTLRFISQMSPGSASAFETLLERLNQMEG